MEKRQGSPVVELSGNRRAVVDGCDGIVDYNEEMVNTSGRKVDPAL